MMKRQPMQWCISYFTKAWNIFRIDCKFYHYSHFVLKAESSEFYRENSEFYRESFNGSLVWVTPWAEQFILVKPHQLKHLDWLSDWLASSLHWGTCKKGSDCHCNLRSLCSRILPAARRWVMLYSSYVIVLCHQELTLCSLILKAKLSIILKNSAST